MWSAANRWLAVRLETLGAVCLLCAALLVVWGCASGSLSASTAGLVLSYSLSITRVLSFGVRASTQVCVLCSRDAV